MITCSSQGDLKAIREALDDLLKSEVKDFLPKIESIHFVTTLQPNSGGMSELRLKIMNVAEKAEATPAGLFLSLFASVCSKIKLDLLINLINYSVSLCQPICIKPCVKFRFL